MMYDMSVPPPLLLLLLLLLVLLQMKRACRTLAAAEPTLSSMTSAALKPNHVVT
jgi:hypothetical protein